MQVTHTNLNSILMTVTLGVLSFVGWGVHKSREDISHINATLVTAVKTEERHYTEVVELRTRIAAIEVEVAKLKFSISRSNQLPSLP